MPRKCKPGFYSPSKGNTQESDCQECNEGEYCNGWGLTKPSGNCSAGFYCPPGQNTSNPEQYRCTPGHFCRAGSKAETPCPSGSYQDEFYKETCKECPEGYFCDGLILNDTFCSHGVQFPQKCPSGFYCRPASETGKENKCPKGIF